MIFTAQTHDEVGGHLVEIHRLFGFNSIVARRTSPGAWYWYSKFLEAIVDTNLILLAIVPNQSCTCAVQSI